MNKQLLFGTVVLTISIALVIIVSARSHTIKRCAVGLFISRRSLFVLSQMMILEGWVGNCDPTMSPSDANPCVHFGLRTVSRQ